MAWTWLPVVLTLLIPCTKPNLVSIAGGKPTFQSSIAHGGDSSRAVDGNKNAHYSQGSCTHTVISTTNPWWAVDLQWSRQVDSVYLTNRADNGGFRLNSIRIGTTDMNPATTAPTPSNFAICASQDEAVGDGATQEFACGGKGRYLVVLLEGTDKVLTLCEVEVYASRTKLQFRRSVNSRLVGYVLETKEVISTLECASVCMINIQCSSFNLQIVTSESMTCELNDDISEEQITNGLTTDPQYTFYKIYYQE